MNNHAIHIFQRNIANVTQAVFTTAYPANTADDELFLTTVQVPATGITVVILDSPGHIVTRQTIGQQPVRIELHLVLSYITTKGQHFGHTPDRHQQQFHNPVVITAQGGGIVFFRIIRAQDVLVYLPQPGGIGSDARCADAVGYLLTRCL